MKAILLFFVIATAILGLACPGFSQEKPSLRLLQTPSLFNSTPHYYTQSCNFLWHPRQIIWQCQLFGGENKEEALWVGKFKTDGTLQKEWFIDAKELAQHNINHIGWIDRANRFIATERNFPDDSFGPFDFKIFKLYAVHSEAETISFYPYFTGDNESIDKILYSPDIRDLHLLFMNPEEMILGLNVVSSEYERKYTYTKEDKVTIQKWQLSPSKKIWQTDILPFIFDEGLTMIPSITGFFKHGDGFLVLGSATIDDFDESKFYEVNGLVINDPANHQYEASPTVSFFSCLSKNGNLEKSVIQLSELTPIVGEDETSPSFLTWSEDLQQKKVTIEVYSIDENCQPSPPQLIFLNVPRSSVTRHSYSGVDRAFRLSDGGLLILYVVKGTFVDKESYRIAKINDKNQVVWDMEVPEPPADKENERFVHSDSDLQVELFVPPFDPSHAYLSVVKRFELDDTVFLPKTVPQLYIISLQ